MPPAYKSTSAVAFAIQKYQTATALLTRCKVYAAASFLLFLPFASFTF